jgi:Ca2+-binding RTX toxin-like protein
MGAGSTNLIVGNGADDTIIGGTGNDLIVTNGGNDSISAGGGNDLIIAAALGGQYYDNNEQGLFELFGEWTSGDTLANRVAYLTTNPNGDVESQFLLVPNSTIFDGGSDTITTGGGDDFLIYNFNNTTVTDLALSDITLNLA